MRVVAHPSLVLSAEYCAIGFVLTSADGFWTGGGWALELRDAHIFKTRALAYADLERRYRFAPRLRRHIQVRGVRQV